jgi:hypothetical protein
MTFAAQGIYSSPRRRSRMPWTYLVACWAYFSISLYGIFRATPIFASLFQGLGIELPLATRFLVTTYWWLCPLLSVSILALPLVKQFFVINKKLGRVIDVYLIVVALFSGPLMVYVLYWPLFIVIHKLSS